MNWMSQKLIKSRKLGENIESCIADDVAAIKCKHWNCLILTNQYSLLIPKACELGEPKKYMLTCQSRVKYSQTIGFTSFTRLLGAFSFCNGLSLSWSPSKRTLYFEWFWGKQSQKFFDGFFGRGFPVDKIVAGELPSFVSNPHLAHSVPLLSLTSLSKISTARLQDLKIKREMVSTSFSHPSSSASLAFLKIATISSSSLFMFLLQSILNCILTLFTFLAKI